MNLILWRHAEAEDFAPSDLARALTTKGRKQAQNVAKWLRTRLPDDALILHPGPTNLGVELTSEVAADHRSLILDQVANGVSLRMAVLFLLLGSGRDLVPDGVRDELPDEEAPGP